MATGNIRKYRRGYILALNFNIGELDRLDMRKLIKMYNLDADVNRSYEMRLVIHDRNWQATTEEAQLATTGDSIFFRVSFSGNYAFQYVAKFVYKHSGQFNIIGSEMIDEIPYIWVDSDTELVDGVTTLVSD
jgi:hypothetical protein